MRLKHKNNLIFIVFFAHLDMFEVNYLQFPKLIQRKVGGVIFAATR